MRLSDILAAVAIGSPTGTLGGAAMEAMGADEVGQAIVAGGLGFGVTILMIRVLVRLGHADD